MVQRQDLNISHSVALSFEDWGLVDYEQAVDRQLVYVDEVSCGLRSETLVFCQHPSVVTIGRKTPKRDLQSWQGPVYQSSRGGRATYHGPNQIVGYPIINLTHSRRLLRSRDIHHYLRGLEQTLIRVLAQFKIEGHCREGELFDDHGERLELTGVWVGEQKIASVGIAVKKWTTYHGFALNIENDLSAFQGIQPCGFHSSVMTSMEEQLGKKLDRAQVLGLLQKEFNRWLD